MEAARNPAQFRLLLLAYVPTLASRAGRGLDLVRRLEDRHQLRVVALDTEHPDPGMLETLLGFIREEKIEIVHALDTESAVWGLPLARLGGAKTVLNREGVPLEPSLHRHPREAELSRAADLVVASSQLVVEQLTELEGLPSDHTVLIRPGFDLCRWDARVNDARGGDVATLFPAGARVIVASGDLDSESCRMEDFLFALSMTTEKHPEMCGAIVGRGRRMPQLVALASSLGISDRVQFLGARTDLPALYGRALAAVVLEDGNPTLHAALEPLASGCPAMVPAGCEGAVALDAGDHGQTFQTNRPALLARCFTALLKDPARARNLGRSGRAHVEALHGANDWLIAHEALYERLAAGDGDGDGGDAEPALTTGGTYGQLFNGPDPVARER